MRLWIKVRDDTEPRGWTWGPERYEKRRVGNRARRLRGSPAVSASGATDDQDAPRVELAF